MLWIHGNARERFGITRVEHFDPTIPDLAVPRGGRRAIVVRDRVYGLDTGRALVRLTGRVLPARRIVSVRHVATTGPRCACSGRHPCPRAPGPRCARASTECCDRFATPSWARGPRSIAPWWLRARRLPELRERLDGESLACSPRLATTGRVAAAHPAGAWRYAVASASSRRHTRLYVPGRVLRFVAALGVTTSTERALATVQTGGAAATCTSAPMSCRPSRTPRTRAPESWRHLAEAWR